MARFVAGVLQVGGLAAVVAGLWLMWAPAGLIAAGLVALIVGILAEQRGGGVLNARKPAPPAK